MDLGIVSLSDLQTDPATGQRYAAGPRIEEIIGYAQLADSLGLDLFALGEHHAAEFAVSSPAVVLAAIATRTSSIRLTSAVTVLSALDPVRVYEDFATLDLISGGRAELIVGRSAFVEPFALFGIDTADYDDIFAEKLDLLLRLRTEDRLSWSGRFRPPISDAAVAPRAQQQPLPVWVGVGGTPASAQRAGRLGLPMVLGLIGGSHSPSRPRRLPPLPRVPAAQDAWRTGVPGQPGPVRGRNRGRERADDRVGTRADHQACRGPRGTGRRPGIRAGGLGRPAPRNGRGFHFAIRHRNRARGPHCHPESDGVRAACFGGRRC
jgi:hypothetical protein